MHCLRSSVFGGSFLILELQELVEGPGDKLPWSLSGDGDDDDDDSWAGARVGQGSLA